MQRDVLKCLGSGAAVGMLAVALTAQVSNQAPALPLVRPITNGPPPLVWDAMAKEVRVKTGETNASFTFYCTNVSAAEVLIHSTSTSCGCTVASLPSYPYRIPPKGTGRIEVAMDLRGKYGLVTKTVTVNSSFGPQYLTTSARVPDPVLTQANPMTPNQMSEQQRAMNQNLAKADRQLVFKGGCATCHVEPARNKTGKELFAAACGICHDAAHRATMVPDLRTPKRPAQRDYWLQWVMFGKPGTLMPAFAKSQGGPLTDEQVFSLVEYLVGPFQNDANPVAPAPQPPVAAPPPPPATPAKVAPAPPFMPPPRVPTPGPAAVRPVTSPPPLPPAPPGFPPQ